MGIGPAQAQDFDVWIVPRHVKVNSGACRDIPFTVRHNGGYLDRFVAEVEVWKGSKYMDQTYDYVYDSAGALRGSYFWCPYEGLGTFRLGPTQVEWNDYSYDDEGSFRDRSIARFQVLQASNFRKVRIAKRGAVRTVHARLVYFDTGSESWEVAPKGTPIRLQRMAGGRWTYLKTGRVGKGGYISISVKAQRAREYRLIFGKTSRTWGANSLVLRK